jgi:dolichyl-phosphate-mannose--protein O-mannosyl transferase
VDAIRSVAWLANGVIVGIGSALLLTLVWLLFRIPARRNWLASVLMIGAAVAAFVPALGAAALFSGFVISVVALVILRFGVLAAVAYYFTFYCAELGGAPWTTSVSVWYARTMFLGIVAILAVALYAFRTTLAGRPLWRDELQRDTA